MTTNELENQLISNSPVIMPNILSNTHLVLTCDLSIAQVSYFVNLYIQLFLNFLDSCS